MSHDAAGGLEAAGAWRCNLNVEPLEIGSRRRAQPHEAQGQIHGVTRFADHNLSNKDLSK